MKPGVELNKWLVVGVIDLVLVNLLVVWLVFRPVSTGQEITSPSTLVSGGVGSSQGSCGADCRAYIDQRVAALSGMVPVASSVASPTPVVVMPTPQAVKTKTKTVEYFSILVNGQTSNNDWTDLPGTEFYFDTSNYSGLVEIDFESNMKLINGNGLAYTRIFDVTHGIAVSGSEVSAGSQTATVVSSGALSFWAGNNLYRVQAKSLTADTAVFNSGRLKITREN